MVDLEQIGDRGAEFLCFSRIAVSTCSNCGLGEGSGRGGGNIRGEAILMVFALVVYTDCLNETLMPE